MRLSSLHVIAALGALFTLPSAAADLSVVLEPKSGSNVHGQFKLAEAARGVRITGELSGLTPGPHGFHVHEIGDCSGEDAASAGGHFNPAHKHHGGLQSQERHAGDLGNIQANASGIAKVDVTGAGLSISGDRPESIRGRALVVHAQSDDGKSDPAGNSGSRIACGVISKSEK